MKDPNQVNEPLAHYGQAPASADADFKGSLVAIKRAALRARQLADQTGTDLIVVRSGQLVRVPPRSRPAS